LKRIEWGGIMEVVLYAKCTSKLSSKRKWWEWTSYPSTYTKKNRIPMLKTTIKIDISNLKHSYTKGIGYRVIIKNKSLHRKLMNMSSVIN
jgi:hypothetical protein